MTTADPTEELAVTRATSTSTGNELLRVSNIGITLIVVEQSLNIAAQLCDRAVFLEKGQIRFEGRTVDLLEQDDIARAVFFGGAVTPDADASGPVGRK